VGVMTGKIIYIRERFEGTAKKKKKEKKKIDERRSREETEKKKFETQLRPGPS